jgi:hypothetical protein
MTEMTRFYLGTHEPAWLERTDAPLFVSHRRLAQRRRLPRAAGAWALDSGGFTELAMHGGWSTSPATYAAAVRRYRDEIGGLAWAAPQDWMCEPSILARTGLTVERHQERTVANLVDLRELAPDLPIVPVLQGWTLADYHRCVDQYQRAGVDLQAEPIVGLGSVCRRQATGEIEEIVQSLAALGLRLHGFGVKTAGLGRYAEHLVSADSLAWSYDARRSEPLAGCRHRNCANCLAYALAWRDRILGRLRSVQLSLPVAAAVPGPAGAGETPAWSKGTPPAASGPAHAMWDAARPAPGVATAAVAADALTCAHCLRSFSPTPRRRGSPQRFCKPKCREAARLRRERGLPEDRPIEPNRHGRRRLGAGEARAS